MITKEQFDSYSDKEKISILNRMTPVMVATDPDGEFVALFHVEDFYVQAENNLIYTYTELPKHWEKMIRDNISDVDISDLKK